MPSSKQQLTLQRAYSPEEYGRIARGLVPKQMEDKWFIFLENDRLHLCRSWTGYCIYEVAFVEQNGQHVIAEAWVNRDPGQYASTDDRHDALLLAYLIDHLMLGRDVEFPERSEIGEEQNAVYQWSMSGRGREGVAPEQPDS
mgnify:CR=1 FL=1